MFNAVVLEYILKQAFKLFVYGYKTKAIHLYNNFFLHFKATIFPKTVFNLYCFVDTSYYSWVWGLHFTIYKPPMPTKDSITTMPFEFAQLLSSMPPIM